MDVKDILSDTLRFNLCINGFNYLYCIWFKNFIKL